MNSDNRQYVILDSAEKMVNKVLLLDEETLVSLAILAGKVFEIDVLNTDIRIFILPSGEGITLASEYEGKADVAIKGRPSALLGMITAEKVGAGDIEINGNVGLAQKFQSILKNMDVDWEEYLSHFVGDITAHNVGNFLRGVSRFAMATGKTIGMDISEYLRYEKEALLDKLELDEFIQTVDKLRNDVERLQKRVERLGKEKA
ncbi:MAG: SCP2 sterol-binding domain-containing protein [Gammaproteobacteria bacterium]|nr:SCP2 sterol-binding domain-containing protein [Gammaproteobacteria bacterium]MCK5668086.1 SCP2 sterol-binding domain-containing protein [Gammaproteobacteria bacterium]